MRVQKVSFSAPRRLDEARDRVAELHVFGENGFGSMCLRTYVSNGRPG